MEGGSRSCPSLAHSLFIIIAGQSRCVNFVIVALPLYPVRIVSRDVDD